ncbi:MAG: amino acid ABC transporter permease [Gemmobacter sp.]
MSDAFFRQDMLPERAPPITEAGAVKWIRENLVSSWLNGILTVLSLYVIVSLLLSIVPWFANSVWYAGSLSECREILGGRSGGCFAVIRERWLQLLFGAYPPALYWRPVLAFVLMFVALSPLLFSGLPRRMLWFSAAYPFLGYWLIWGGTIWFATTAALGFVAAGIAYRLLLSRGGGLPLIAAFLAAVLWWMFIAGPLTAILSPALPIGIDFVRSDRLGGFLISMIIGVSGIVLSLPLGILLALGRRSDMLIVKSVSVVFIEFIRGVPLITLLFSASLLLNYFLPPGTNFDLILRVIIMVTIFSAAYIAEVVRGGLAALPRGQYEAADSLGLDYWGSMQLIILPQALKISIPGIVNTFIGLFKDTTLVVFIGLLDPLNLANAIRADTNWNGIYWEIYIFIAALFFAFCFAISRYSMYLERRLKTDHR